MMTSQFPFHLDHMVLYSDLTAPSHKSRFGFKFLLQCPPAKFLGTGSHQIIIESKHVRKSGGFRPICAASHPALGFIKESVPYFKWLQTVKDDVESNEEDALHQVVVTNEIRKKINVVKRMLGSMEDGEISISAYDTAWVGLVRDVNGGGGPQFPSCLQWIASNQLSDGSWGDAQLFNAHDRILNTLACVIALRAWNLHPQKSHMGLKFVKQNLSKLEDENVEHMPIGFEVAFPSLLDLARSMNIEVPHDSPILKQIFAMRDLKLTKIPMEVLHKVPTTLLHSLEGMANLDWKRLLKLQSQDGSFLFSPSSTAYAFMQTKDENALKYLDKTVKRFTSGVPNVYPVDLFEHIWAVDRLERLGISRYFQTEIKECMEYVSRYWTEKGICWARNSEVQDIDDTAMAFRLLRLHGHQVSPDAFKHFEKRGEFFCFAGQSNQAITGIYNLYRASQVLFPGEKILEDAKLFSSKFLTEKRLANEIVDKWIVTKDLVGEVSYALDVPWYASLPFLETRFFIEQYGGDNDIWIGKSLYRMPYVNNDTYLELAKLDYNNCQVMLSAEWEKIKRWYSETRLEEFDVCKESVLQSYFLAAASIFEPERTLERLAWAKTATLIETLKSYIKDEEEAKRAFAEQFNNSINRQDFPNKRLDKSNKTEKLVWILLITIEYLGLEFFRTHGQEISPYLNLIWQSWLFSWQKDGSSSTREAELILQTIHIMSGCWSQELQLNLDYQKLLQVTNKVYHKLRHYQSNKVNVNGSCNMGGTRITTPQIESDMQELLQIVFQHSANGIQNQPRIKNSFLKVAKSFYYAAYFDYQTIMSHVDKVLFQKVM